MTKNGSCTRQEFKMWSSKIKTRTRTTSVQSWLVMKNA